MVADAIRLEAPETVEVPLGDLVVAPCSCAAELEAEDYARVLGHDLRAPVAAMAACAQALAEDAGDRLTATEHEYLDAIVRGGERAVAMIRGLQQLSRASSAQLQPEIFDARAEVESLIQCELATVVASSPGATIHVGQLRHVEYDRALFRVVMLNLLSNALKFVAPGTTPHVEISSRGTAHAMVTICVRDNGIGIPREQQRRIFDTSVRLHGDRDYDGSGLGLATVRRVVERGGGAIELRSAPGHGSEFRITIPGGVPRVP